MANKITNVNALSMAIETLASVENFSAEALEKLENIKASYEKKSTGERKPTQNQLDNEKLKAQIIELLGAKPEYLFTVSEIVKALEVSNGAEYSNQKISALCSALFKSEMINKVADKRKSFYRAI